jgi:hypothetical protein
MFLSVGFDGKFVKFVNVKIQKNSEIYYYFFSFAEMLIYVLFFLVDKT